MCLSPNKCAVEDFGPAQSKYLADRFHRETQPGVFGLQEGGSPWGEGLAFTPHGISRSGLLTEHPGPPPTSPSQRDHLPCPPSFYSDPQAFSHGCVRMPLPPPEAPPCPTLSENLDLRTHSQVASPQCWAFPVGFPQGLPHPPLNTAF